MPATWKDVLGDVHTDELEQACKDYVGKNFVSKADYNAKVRQIGEHEKTIQDQTTELDNLRKTNVDAAEYQKQIDTLNADHAAAIERVEIEKIAFMKAVENGAIDPKQVLLLLTPYLATAKRTEDGTDVEGLDDQVKALVEGKGTAGMFSKTNGGQQVAGAEPGNPGSKGGQDVDINTGTYSQYIAAHQS